MKFDRYCNGSYINGPCNKKPCRDFNPCDCNNDCNDNCNNFPPHFPNFPCHPNFPQVPNFPCFPYYPNFQENKNCCCIDPMWLFLAGIIICNNKRKY